METIELEYVHIEKELQLTPFEFPVVPNLVEYNNANIRNRVIVRFDLIHGMTQIFGENLPEKDRVLAFCLTAGMYQKTEEMSVVLLYFYKEYATFHNRLSEIFLFDEEISTSPISILMLRKMVDTYTKLRDSLIDALHAQRCKTILESDGYLYVAVPDEDITVKVRGYYNEEVLSRAKVWKSQFTRI